MWLTLAFISAALLGMYEVFKKAALDRNAVIPVLFLNTVFCSLIFLPLIVLSYAFPETIQHSILYVPKVPFTTHLYIILKAVIVLSSWIFAYFAMKHLPITIAATIKASQPVLTLLGALLIFGERLNLYQWIGVSLSILSFFLLSSAGRKEGIRFSHNIWIWFIVLATITGSVSGLYDKYLMSRFDRMTVQVWYNYYQMGIMFIILMFLWYPKRKQTTPFRWRNSIFFISLFLVAADFVYFYALSYPDSMISIVSMVRRSGVIVSFTAGVFFFKEKNIRRKAIDLVLVLIGMYFLYLGTK
ncbi:DMT family transporter [Coprobacter tertius]|uniref:DMT family transporter n=1 Tax=Coprobacter tertius TaxID=2944915 RepID=A0ABT1MKE3_9BACT|nr:DMT family transporter [Coprobacter tertius]MCP9613092.1 DMT family transporter [Coprobacter tertius]